MKRTIIFEKKVLVQQAISVEYKEDEQKSNDILNVALDKIVDDFGIVCNDYNDINEIAYILENDCGINILNINDEYDIEEEPLEYYDDFEEDEE